MKGFAKNFRELDVYQSALEMAAHIHDYCKTLPPEEKYALADQMRRASRSVCSNIAEAWRKRRYRAAFVSKLNDAETEACEMQSWFDITRKINYLSEKEHKIFDDRYEHIISQLVVMIRDAEKWCR